MNYPFAYRVPALYAKYKQIRNITYWAGALGVFQALIMMGLTITGILAYNCIVPAPLNTTFGNLISYTFYILYFKGDCKPENFVQYNYTILSSVPTVQEPMQLLIWQSVYLGVATFWLISSVLLLTHVKKQDPKLTLGNLSGWVILTFFICVLDFSLGIIFGIDYGNFHDAALDWNFAEMNGVVTPNNMQLVAASVVAVSMMIVSLKGFLLWIINAGFVIYFLVILIGIGTIKDSNDSLFMPRQENDDILATQPPISAYEEKSPPVGMAYSNQAYVPENRNTSSVELNQDSIARAARISTDVQMNERRFRNLDTFQQYPPPPQYNQQHRPEPPQHNNNTNAIPMPDYSPPMSRSNQRYQ